VRALALSFALLLAVRAAPAQTSAPAATYRIAGTVVAEGSGQPVQRATVHILQSGNFKAVQETTSDEYGHFAFTGVPAGKFILNGTAPGYLLTDYDAHDTFTTGIVIGAGLDTESLVLKLRPLGSLTGTILDESGEPVERANIRLFRQSHSFGDSRMVSANSGSTDDLGHFEISRLAPGNYMLAVTATPWYAVHPPPPQQRQNQGFGFADFVDPSLDVAYPTTYYPGTTDSNEATPILIRGGPADISLRLSAQPALSISFPFTPPQNGQGYSLPQLRTSVFGQIEPVGAAQYQQSNTQMVITGLAPGDYYLSPANQPFSQPLNQTEAGLTPLHLTDRNTDAALPAPADVAHVHLLLKASDGTAVPTILVGFMRRHTLDFAARTNAVKGEAKFDVAPGDYYVSLCGAQRRCYVRQVLAGDRPLPANDIHIASGADLTFTVVFDIGTHTVKGVVQKDGKPAPGAFLLLFPANQSKEIRSVLRDQSDLDGSFEFTGLAPGAYTILSIENGWDLDWQREAVLALYLPSAITVQVTESPANPQILSSPVPLQPR
jgi:hypothetical protein